ncbi:branched-chain amino acid ABC transporter permease [Brevibacillus brevis]|uniref:Branched-chain amino acid ABC transporter permease n=1 Tax=Brevibacillus brevis TaxID=1393 RepID=A0ABY9SYE7_BREBE|nr:branched-chain amino acid ABC transporter permease [Brevibacillus brevis]WNC12299.1 branched-chain amino acid ABC transporter permease [Brevibacillus brevis]
MLFLQLITNGIVTGFLYGLLALSFAVVLSVCKVWHFAHAGVMSVSAYMIYLFYNMLQLPLWLSFSLTLMIMIAVGFMIDRFGYQPLRKRKSGVLIFFIVSLMLTTLFENLISIFFGNQTQTFSLEDEERYDLGFVNLTSWDLRVIIVCGILIAAFLAMIRWTKIGHALNAVATNPEMAETVGINTKSIYATAVIIASVMAVPATFLVGQKSGIEPTMGFGVLLTSIVATVVGGVGNYTGAMIAGFLIAIVENIGIWQISSQWQHSIVFGILFLCIIFRPRGLMGQRTGG